MVSTEPFPGSSMLDANQIFGAYFLSSMLLVLPMNLVRTQEMMAFEDEAFEFEVLEVEVLEEEVLEEEEEKAVEEGADDDGRLPKRDR